MEINVTTFKTITAVVTKKSITAHCCGVFFLYSMVFSGHFVSNNLRTANVLQLNHPEAFAPRADSYCVYSHNRGINPTKRKNP